MNKQQKTKWLDILVNARNVFENNAACFALLMLFGWIILPVCIIVSTDCSFTGAVLCVSVGVMVSNMLMLVISLLISHSQMKRRRLQSDQDWRHIV